MVPCILFEDDDLLVISKPPGINTHAPGPFAPDGIYDWLRNREPRWADLSILQRLDKETSGVMLFGKSGRANRGLSAQFEGRQVGKRYLLRTNRPPSWNSFEARSRIARAGDRYQVASSRAGGNEAVTRFVVKTRGQGDALIEAIPETGRTHQIRVHAASNGFPILGDALYGGSPFPRVCLHAASIDLRHPVSGGPLHFDAPVDFETPPDEWLRRSILDPAETTAFRWVNGAGDGMNRVFIDQWDEALLVETESPIEEAIVEKISRRAERLGRRSVYSKLLSRRPGAAAEESPRRVWGDPLPERFPVLENGISFEIGFSEGYSVGLFLDQRDNRRRILTGHVSHGFPLNLAGKTVLNTFAYTCGFSICAARAGARTTSLDLSKKYLEWGKRNFSLNGVEAADHAFIYGDVFDWSRRFRKRGERFDFVIADPPSFSRSRESGVFQVERNFPDLLEALVPLVRPGGGLLVSCNLSGWKAEDFVESTLREIGKLGRHPERTYFAPQPPDFPAHPMEPAYFKSLWIQFAD